MKKQVLLAVMLLSTVASSKLQGYCLELLGDEEVKVVVLKSKKAWEDLKKTKDFFDWAKTQAKQAAGVALSMPATTGGSKPAVGEKAAPTISGGQEKVGGVSTSQALSEAEKAQAGMYKYLDKEAKGKSLKTQTTADIARQLSSPLGTLIGNIQLAVVRIGDANYLTPKNRKICYDWIQILTRLKYPYYKDITKKELGDKDAAILRDVANFEKDHNTTLD